MRDWIIFIVVYYACNIYDHARRCAPCSKLLSKAYTHLCVAHLCNLHITRWAAMDFVFFFLWNFANKINRVQKCVVAITRCHRIKLRLTPFRMQLYVYIQRVCVTHIVYLRIALLICVGIFKPRCWQPMKFTTIKSNDLPIEWRPYEKQTLIMTASTQFSKGSIASHRKSSFCRCCCCCISILISSENNLPLD